MAKLTEVVPYDPENPETRVTLVLRLNGNGTDLQATKQDGTRTLVGLVLSFSPSGLERVENVDPDFGFPLDDRGRIKLNERP